jgi:hypothetical protein
LKVQIAVRLSMQLDERKLRGAVDGNGQVELAFLGAYLGNVNVELRPLARHRFEGKAETDGIGLELALPGLGVFHLRKPGDAVALQAAVQR